MDDTQPSRASDAGATRKRRSSILKLQRAPRAPFSELEFNVATPTDTTKSRRVSFSRRTGVAEFVTNEATTTWKNFYEEHNKTLESSGNDSEVKPPRPSVGHIGKSIFDQYFQEVEAVDLVSTMEDGRSRNIETSLNNFAEQFASLETTNDTKLTAPQRNFELSAFTDHQSKTFADDLGVNMGELSDRINVNFSQIQPISDTKDDLDEIQRDLQQQQYLCQGPAVICPGPFRSGRDMSEYIEVDLNMTNVAIRNEESDMSITDTISSPKVQDVSKNMSVDKKSSLNKDWVADKENILVVNPYVTPKESTNFAINEEPDKVLVFDGKRLTIQSDKETEDLDYRRTLLPNTVPDQTPQRKSIFFNVNDDLPNVSMSHRVLKGMSISTINQTVCDGDLSMTHPLANKVEVNEKRRTIVYENDGGDLSITEAVSVQILPNKVEKRKTIVYESDSADISVTQAVSSNIILGQSLPERRKTIVYEDDAGDISLTQAVPKNIVLPNKSDTIAFETDSGDISMTQVIPSNLILPKPSELISERRRTVVYGDNISLTQVVPSNLDFDVTSKHGRTVVYDSDSADISVTQAIPSKIMTAVKEAERRRTIVYESDDANISMTQAIPSNVILTEISSKSEKRKTIVFESDSGDLSVTEAIPSNLILPDKKASILYDNDSPDVSAISANLISDEAEVLSGRRKTIVYEDDAGNISITRAIPSNLILPNEVSERRRTIVFETESGNISVTEAIPANIILAEKSKTITDNSDSGDISISQVASENILTSETAVCSKKSDSDTYNVTSNPSSDNTKQDSSDADMSMTRSDETCGIIPTVNTDKESVDMSMSEDLQSLLKEESTKRKTILFENEIGNMSITKPIPTNIMSVQKDLLETSKFGVFTMTKEGHCSVFLETEHVKQDIFVYQTDTDNASIMKTDEHGISKSVAPSDSSYGQITPTSAESNQKVQGSKENLETEAFSTSAITTSNMSRTEQKSKKSILDDLLDMSTDSEDKYIDLMEGGIDDKCIMAQVESQESKCSATKPSYTSNESIFFVTKDNEDETQTDKQNVPKITNQSPKQLEYKTEEDDDELKISLLKLKEVDKQLVGNNRLFEKVMSSDPESTDSADKTSKDRIDTNKSNKILTEANTTRELLEMISDFTDKEEEANPIEEDETENVSKSVSTENQLEDKTEMPLMRRLSFAPNRQSIVISREDLIHSISMAQAVLQHTRVESDDDESLNDNDTTVPTPDTGARPRKGVRMSSDIVKTLHFEDEPSYEETSIKSDMKTTPLKKTAFGEHSYMKDTDKAHVIPTFLKDVSDNMKQLMSDLVKPINDEMPFESGMDKSVKRAPSTCSLQIQANLATSSQIDIDPETYSNPGYSETENPGFVDSLKNITQVLTKAPSEIVSKEIPHDETTSYNRSPHSQTVPGRMLVFDPRNPLNNVLFQPMDYTDVHKYNPGKSTVTLVASDHSGTKVTFSGTEPEYHVGQVSTQIIRSLTPIPYTASAGDACSDKSDKMTVKESEEISVVSNLTKTISVDRGIDPKVIDVKDTEVNTLIIMKANKELIETDSSLTLVDDAFIVQEEFDVDVDTQESEESVEALELHKIDAQESNDEELQAVQTKARKRSYSPTSAKKKNWAKSVDTPPKPSTKMQKVSNSPHTTINNITRIKASPESSKSPKHDEDVTRSDANKTVDLKKHSPKSKKKPKTKCKKDETIVQQLTECNSKDDRCIELICSQMLKNKADEIESETVSEVQSVDDVRSFTSKTIDDRSVTTIDYHQCLKSLPMDWHPELLNELSSKNLVTECESSVNVVAKIDMLPFMGSRDCEWEPCSGDSWSFRLLHGRLRLAVRLAPHAAASHAVRADTPVVATALETLHHDKKNSVAVLCVRFAAEAIRYLLGRGCARAGDVPALLRRCAGVARVALRWGRAMHDAALRLAFTINDSGQLTLKVANIPLRSVWEVTMKLEMMVDDAREVPWPGARGVRVAAVVSDYAVTRDEARRALRAVRRDWGHAPRTIWKIFKYLKNKTRDDDLLLGL